MTASATLTRGPRWAPRLDWVVCLLTITLAGLISSFWARNSDLWQHLATGRMIASGDYSFSADPLSFLPFEHRWINHTWLTDWFAYQIYSLLGGEGLVLLKALMIATVAILGMRRLQREQPRWLAFLYIGLILLAWSPRATLQPLTLSCFFLAVLLFVLNKEGRAYLALPALIILWVNMEDWFLLGPVLVLLYWACGRIQGRRQMPDWVPLACIAAGFVSPFHVHGWTLPPELSPAFWSSELAHDPRLLAQFESPFNIEYRADTVLYRGAWTSYCLLLMISGIVLIPLSRKRELATILTVVALTGLSVWQERLVPLAMAADVILLAQQIQAWTPGNRVGKLGQGMSFILILGAILAVWTGWIPGSRDRILGLGVAIDPTVQQAAETLIGYRKEGVLASTERVLATSPDATNILAWLVPGERGYIDTRWGWHARNGVSNLDFIQAAFLSDPADTRIRDHHIGAVLLVDPTPAMIQAVVTQPERWRILKLDGRALWVQPKANGDSPREGVQSHADRLAFAAGNSGEPEASPMTMPRYPDWKYPLSADRQWPSRASTTAEGYLDFQLGAKLLDPAYAWLAIREARRGLTASPNNSPAWFELGRAYTVLGATSENGAVTSEFQGEWHRVQRVTALTAAVTANPESEKAIDALASTLADFGYLDLSLVQRRNQLALLKRRGDSERIRQVKDQIVEIENDLFDREALYLIRTRRRGSDPLVRARIALELGLARTAQDTFLKASPDLYGVEGLRLLAKMLLETGQYEEARVLLDRKELSRKPAVLGLQEVVCLTEDRRRVILMVPAYDWFRFLLSASTGSEDPRPYLAAMRQYGMQTLKTVPVIEAQMAAPVSRQVATQVALGTTLAWGSRLHVEMQRDVLLARISQARLVHVQLAELRVLEAKCELERGNPAGARQRFQEAITQYKAIADLKVAPSRKLAEQYLNKLDAVQKP